MYKLKTTKKFDTAYKKLSPKDKDLTDKVISILLSGEKLDAKYKDHKLKGEYINLRDCHIKPDLVLIYEILEDILILNAFRLGSHSDLF